MEWDLVDLGVDLVDLGVDLADLVDLEADLVDLEVDLVDLEVDLVDLVDFGADFVRKGIVRKGGPACGIWHGMLRHGTQRLRDAYAVK